MDLSMVENLIPDLAALFNVQPATMILLLGVFVSLCNLAGRLIPDEASGWLAILRKFCKLVGLYASNRVSKGVSVNDVTKVLLESKVPGTKDEKGKFISATVEDVARNLK